MNNELRRIANTLILYSYHVISSGLFSGKTGILLYLYRYAQYADCKYCRNFADGLLDEVLASVSHTPFDFENGLTGIGWSVNYLLQEGLISGDPNEILEDLDNKVFSFQNIDFRSSIFGQGIYLLERLKENEKNAKFENYVTTCLDVYFREMNGYKGFVSLYHINSLLFFLTEVERQKKNCGSINSIIKILPSILEKIFYERAYDEADLYLYNRIREDIYTKQDDKWKDVISLNPTTKVTDLNIETKIKILWFEKLYLKDKQTPPLSLDEISKFINEKQENIILDNLLFFRGLSGLGNVIIQI